MHLLTLGDRRWRVHSTIAAERLPLRLHGIVVAVVKAELWLNFRPSYPLDGYKGTPLGHYTYYGVR